MSVQLVVVQDERGIEIFFVDYRDACGSLADSRWFPTESAAREWMAMGGLTDGAGR